MFHARNRAVHVVKLEIEAFDPEADVFALTVTLSTYPRDNDCAEAHAVAQTQFPGKKATLALKDVGGRWVYELSDQKEAVNLIGSPTKASAKISGQVVEELKWAIEAEGVPSERLLTLCRWHGSAVDLCADQTSEEATNSEPPLLDMIRKGDGTATTRSAIDDLKQAAEMLQDLGASLKQAAPPQDEPRVFLKSRYIAQVRTSEGTYTVSIATPPDGVEPKPWVCSCNAYHEKDTCPHLALVQQALDDAKAREV